MIDDRQPAGWLYTEDNATDLDDVGAPGLSAVEAIGDDGSATFFVVDRDLIGPSTSTGNPAPPHDVLDPPTSWLLRLPERGVEVRGDRASIHALGTILAAAGETVAAPERQDISR
ncbi:MAG: hypothetical protein QM658_04065 [Gordonia sp. (in: high G+C Gram-positive bacteria)]